MSMRTRPWCVPVAWRCTTVRASSCTDCSVWPLGPISRPRLSPSTRSSIVSSSTRSSAKVASRSNASTSPFRPAAAAPVAAFGLRARPRRAHAGPNPGLAPQPPEQAHLRLFDDLELSVVLVDAQLVEGGLFRLVDGLPRRFDPFHRRYFRFFFLRDAADRLLGGVVRPPLLFAAGGRFPPAAGLAPFAP